VSNKKINNGSTHELTICGSRVKVGFNVVLDVPQLAYRPLSNDRPEVGKTIGPIGDKHYKILEVRQSEQVAKLVVLILEELDNG
jgi:hypothetical protein